ncbi:IS3 family transposase, partial [Paenibacillus terrigena]
RLEEYGMIASHSRRGNCHDNACIESFFSHLKTEKIYLTRPKTADSLYTAIEEYIEFYNHNRFQKKLNNRPPVEYRETAVA